MLINKVHKKRWSIGFRYDSACPAAEHKNSKELKGAITTALQAWLQPLRDLPTEEPIVNDFSYEQQPDIVNNAKRLIDLLGLDFRITFYCLEGRATIWLGISIPPDIYMRRGTKVTDKFMFSIVHELGHAMGLDDTYVGRFGEDVPSVSKGGMEETVGTQPPSIMSSHSFFGAPRYISKDDANGIVWLYKHTYENVALDDCLFPNYEFEQSPDGCRPTNPLIFEIRYGKSLFAEQIIDQDKNLDINARDQHGFTALHYAIVLEKFTVVQKLLAHKDIDLNAKDPEGNTPAQLADKLGMEKMLRLFSGRNLPANKITTWGKMKIAP